MSLAAVPSKHVHGDLCAHRQRMCDNAGYRSVPTLQTNRAARYLGPHTPTIFCGL